ncbi:MAG: rRNA maturation RNase YbeY [Bacteroides sp.]|nr:rRNA maturation RNase YbeY [Bacteroides sp.]MDE7462495.1 rRNA maturation RNase YbeY [Muribaculaceae bacterium]
MVEFQVDGVEMPTIDTAKISKWISAVAGSYDKLVGNLCYRFCNDDAILKTNIEFLGHNYYTDIITFDYTLGRKIGGDMLISLDTVASNAESLGVPYSRELHRVIIHGVLHLCGLKDKEPGEREKMEAAEDKALALYDEI